MKILQLTAHFNPNVGGVETHLNDLVKELINKGHEVFVLTYKPLTAKVVAKIYEKDDRLDILRLPWFPGLFYKLVNKPILEFLYLVPGLFIATPLVLLIKQPDVVHSHGLVAGFIAVFWGKIFKIRVVTTTHSIYHFLSEPKALRAGGLYRNFAKWIFDNADVVLTLSKQSKKEIVELGVEEKKIVVFTYWIDLKKFNVISNKKQAKRKLGWERKFVVLFVGRLVVEKGILQLLEAVKVWNKNFYVIVCGVGPLGEKVRESVDSGLNVMYLGNIEQDELPKIYNAADVTIVPSIHEEGFGRVILESLACGTPVIAANRGAIPEAMDESVGRLIRITPENIKKEVEYFYKNPDKLGKLSKNARKFAEKRYSERNIELIVRSYS
ncbi:MAG: Glycosyltransferase [Candidatus Woesebacteria bacterium GW2011_GWA1_39_21b]|uniref:Glycosyltransferase n=2 Tax=Candidatus Woeseibacteriota TaxID=1752722 RepID=A0A0G0RK64_9BACT|nr:MAG: Glycosyltransferase [Microgenomates group bacterium GW2011_GWC1_38_12]KKR14042.1 MAG: Glycosyltransferase [Candidatus Woesebacteria bacterium GW2011_GWA1_39_21b]OGM65656.1 MAG: hypothetical protein A3A52_02085 [Candidatus Woesebacteria bacterium RIFCSPLOWO2_01_FULL_39_14]